MIAKSAHFAFQITFSASVTVIFSFTFSALLTTPAYLGNHFREIAAVIERATAISSPGRRPARKRAAIDWFAIIPYMRNGLLGGIRIPRAPPLDATAPENFRV